MKGIVIEKKVNVKIIVRYLTDIIPQAKPSLKRLQMLLFQLMRNLP